MNFKLLEPEVQQFITDHTGADVTRLALGKNPFPYLEWQDVLNQVTARTKAKDKLPTWYGAEGILYPSRVSIEQTSSETAARYKAGLVSGESLIDLTGGFGIDDYYFAQNLKEVIHCERSLELSAIAEHNFKVLGAGNIITAPGDSTELLKLFDRKWDWIYIDPSRRSVVKGKVFMLADCEPNVPELLSFYFSYSPNLMIKTAPLLDITAGLNELKHVHTIHIVAVDNEVKELLWILEDGFEGTPVVTAVNVTKDKTETFTVNPDEEVAARFALPQKYLYEPNSAIMKTGAFDAVSQHYNLGKLHRHSQLYTSDEIIDFPGRVFTIDEVLPYTKHAMKKLEGKKMNVTVRNFPLPVSEIKKKWKLKDGGDKYAFFTTDMQSVKIVLLCSKI